MKKEVVQAYCDICGNVSSMELHFSSGTVKDICDDCAEPIIKKLVGLKPKNVSKAKKKSASAGRKPTITEAMAADIKKCLDAGISQAKIADEYGLKKSTLSLWVKNNYKNKVDSDIKAVAEELARMDG